MKDRKLSEETSALAHEADEHLRDAIARLSALRDIRFSDIPNSDMDKILDVLERASEECLWLPSEVADCLSDRVFLILNSVTQSLQKIGELASRVQSHSCD